MYVLIAIVRKELNLSRSMAEMCQVLSVTLFEKMPILQAFSHNTPELEQGEIHNQLSLFDF